MPGGEDQGLFGSEHANNTALFWKKDELVGEKGD